jgi:hypothetical protein
MAKETSKKVASQAAKILSNDSSSKIAKTLAASALSQAGEDKTTSPKVAEIAAKALQSPKYSDLTKTTAGSVLSQADQKQ